MLDMLKELVNAINWEDYIVEGEGGCRFTTAAYSGVVCTGYAVTLADVIIPQAFPDINCDVRGRRYEDHQYPITRFCDGHDLCVVNDRYAIDVWPNVVEGMDWQVVLDMYDESDRLIFDKRYGPFIEYKSLNIKE